jgi:hypothetical protein
MPLVEKNPNYLPIVPNLDQDQLTAVKNISLYETAGNKEACGFILNNGDVIQWTNSHPKPDDHFRLKNYPYSLSEIKVIWHSHFKDTHPGEFTAGDLALSHQTKLPILLYHAGFDEWDYYEPQNPNPFPLTYIPTVKVSDIDYYAGWRFSWGRSDCFSLVRRYFLGTLNIDIGEFRRPHKPPVTDPEWSFEDYWSWDKCFVRLPEGTPPKDHDIFGIALRGGRKANHLAVCVSAKDNLILHITGPNMRSRLDRLDGWRDLVVPGGHGRLKELC